MARGDPEAGIPFSISETQRLGSSAAWGLLGNLILTATALQATAQSLGVIGAIHDTATHSDLTAPVRMITSFMERTRGEAEGRFLSTTHRVATRIAPLFGLNGSRG
ncbi:hypothetical protein SCAR479_13959 [Seiridium cardinale]|uniref:Uncharacterized protein n=1 Tax=Seiridium cardinale TaxID=138064 RepID=A0ABR2X6I2_9PEZI